MMEIAKIEDIKRLCGLIKDNWDLCHFTGQCESEMMVVQTIHGAKINHKKHGECFSFLSANAKTGRRMDGTNNALGLQILFDREFLIQEKRVHGRDVVFPTQALVDALDIHLRQKEAATEE